MYKGKKIIAIIPARSGSKGLKNKNVKLLLNKPLMGYSIEQANECKYIDKVFVSTDSEKYAIIAKEFGAEVPFLRPNTISKGESQAQEYVLNTLKEFETFGDFYDYFIVLQPTSPLRLVNHLERIIELIIDDNLDSVVSVCEADHIPQIYNHLPENQSMFQFYRDDLHGMNRQSLGKYYRLNGSLYCMSVESFYKDKSYFIDNSRAFIMEKQYSIDIDDEFDFLIAESLMSQKE